MPIRIQPHEPEISQEDPFENDLLGRKEPIEVLTSIASSIEGPCVLAVDAPWGTGKTTFLKMWCQYLRNRGFSVVEFNAWETDFSGDPFVALSAEVTEGLVRCAEDSEFTGLDAFRNVTSDLIHAIPGPLFRVATSAIPYVGPQIVKELESKSADTKEDATTGYSTAKVAIRDFKAVLGNTANSLANSRDGNPLVVVIDELDRCRPSYAVALLEVAKHLFTVDHIVFVLAIDRAQLAHSVKVLYGNTFDAEGYLRRFFDVDYRLPYPDRDRFIKAMLAGTGILAFFDRMSDQTTPSLGDKGLVQKLLLDFFGPAELSLREVAQAIHRLGLVFASLSENRRIVALTATIAVILRTTNTDLYNKFVRNEVSDLDVVDEMFSHLGRDVVESYSWDTSVFEALVIWSAQDNAAEGGPWAIYGEHPRSPLMSRYRDLVQQNQQTDNSDDKARQHARHVMQMVRAIDELASVYQGVGFKDAVRRLELLSTNLGQELVRSHRSPSDR